MRKMQVVSVLCLSFLTLTAALQAKAEFGVGVIGAYHASDSWTTTGTPTDTTTGKGGSGYGALIFIPVFPLLSIRAGYENESVSFTNGSGTKFTATNSLIPLDLQFDLPLTGLYIYGGGIFVTGQSMNNGGTKLQSDLRYDLGLGYDIVTLGPIKISLEGEYMVGSKNINPATGYDTKLNSFLVNVVGRITL